MHAYLTAFLTVFLPLVGLALATGLIVAVYDRLAERFGWEK